MDEFSGHLPSLRRYAWHLTRCPERADDLVQDCLTRAIAAADTLRPGAPVRPWLFRILHNAHVSEQRRTRLRDRHQEEVDDEAVAPAQYGHMELQNVLAALEHLPEPQREAICLVALEDLTYAEAASVLGVPVGTLMSRLARGREALRQRLEESPPSKLYLIGGRDAR